VAARISSSRAAFLIKRISMHKWAAFEYRNTSNIGDEIQTIAALQFTPEPTYHIDRDFLSHLAHPKAKKSPSSQMAGTVSEWRISLFSRG
jgi:hypothetical protein